MKNLRTLQLWIWAAIVLPTPAWANLQPSAALSLTPSAGTAPLHVMVDASGSTDADGSVVSYQFDFGDGTVIGPQASPTVVHAFGPGMWITTVIVTDEAGAHDTLVAAVNATVPNLVTNSSFETAIEGWIPNGFATLERVSGGFDGHYALEVRGLAASGKFGANDSPNWVRQVESAGARYRFAAWVRSPSHNSKAVIRVREYQGGVRHQVTDSPAIRLSPDWQLLVVEHVAVTDSGTLDLLVLADPEKEGVVFQIDQVSVCLMVDSPPVVAGPREASGWEHVPITVSIVAADPDDDPITSLTADPWGLPVGHGAVFHPGTHNTSGTLSWTPAEVGGPYVVVFTAANARSTSIRTAITVTAEDVSLSRFYPGDPRTDPPSDHQRSNPQEQPVGQGRRDTVGTDLSGADEPLETLSLARPLMDSELGAAWPNPIHASGTVAFRLAEESGVSLKVYDLEGRHVRTLEQGVLPEGWHRATWDRRDEEGERVRPGVYWYRFMVGGEFAGARRVVTVR